MRSVYAVKIHNSPDVIARFAITQRDDESLDAYYDRASRTIDRVASESLERFGESVVDIDPID